MNFLPAAAPSSPRLHRRAEPQQEKALVYCPLLPLSVAFILRWDETGSRPPEEEHRCCVCTVVDTRPAITAAPISWDCFNISDTTSLLPQQQQHALVKYESKYIIWNDTHHVPICNTQEGSLYYWLGKSRHAWLNKEKHKLGYHTDQFKNLDNRDLQASR